tara:strand:+ start:94 stop:684 length:591 start_codon:yes stop_codon:yes gene_type:complete
MSFEYIDNPIELVDAWLKEAKLSEISDYNAAALSTVSISGKPQVRMVLIKSFDENGAIFYTNLESQKGKALLYNKFASICFHWKSLGKQIRVEGEVEQVSNSLADKYFETRSRNSQVGAWASLQSKKLDSRKVLTDRVNQIERKFNGGKINRPSFWSGFLLIPNKIEFWVDGESRLHERVEYMKTGKSWEWSLLYP